MKRKKTYELWRRLLVTTLILAIYLIGRSLLLYNVDPAAYQLEELNSQNIMIAMISGDRYRYTLFALGVMPYITSNLIMWIYMSIRGSDFKSRFSPQKTERYTLVLMLIIAAVSAISRAEELVFKESSFDVQALRILAVLQMVIGAVVIYKIANLGKEQGIAGQSPIILVNIVDNLVSTLQKFSWQQLQKPVVLCLTIAVLILIMENVFVRIPVQRVSIHNVYAEKSFIPFKLDPIGVMPVMFAVSFFMILQMIVRFFLWISGGSQALQLFYEKLNLTNIVGVSIYLGIIFTLNIAFSFVMLAPGELAEQLQKTGDSIVGIYAGEKTKQYLVRKLLLLAIFSGSILCLVMGISLGLALRGEISPDLALFPATGSIFAGIFCPIYREVKAYWKFDSYSFFV